MAAAPLFTFEGGYALVVLLQPHQVDNLYCVDGFQNSRAHLPIWFSWFCALSSFLFFLIREGLFAAHSSSKIFSPARPGHAILSGAVPVASPLALPYSLTPGPFTSPAASSLHPLCTTGMRKPVNLLCLHPDRRHVSQMRKRCVFSGRGKKLWCRL